MLKFFRHIRKSLLIEHKFSKYALYAVGEIILVVIGILIALQINNWNTTQKNNKQAIFYMKSLANDLKKDTLDINRVVAWQQNDLSKIEDFQSRMHSSTSSIDTIIQIAKHKFDYSFKVKRDYSNNTFNTIISSGTIELLDKALIEHLMELNSMQLDQLKRFESNLEGYKAVTHNYIQRYSINNSDKPYEDFVTTLLWSNINETEFVGAFNATLELRHFTFSNSVDGHLRVKQKSKEILQLIDKLLYIK